VLEVEIQLWSYRHLRVRGSQERVHDSTPSSTSTNAESPNDPQDAFLTYYCLGPPASYTDTPHPCAKCKKELSSAKDTNGSNNHGSNSGGSNANSQYVNGNSVTGNKAGRYTNSNNRSQPRPQFDGGSGNNSFCGTYAAEG
jgi:hypothetical protein